MHLSCIAVHTFENKVTCGAHYSVIVLHSWSITGLTACRQQQLQTTPPHDYHRTLVSGGPSRSCNLSRGHSPVSETPVPDTADSAGEPSWPLDGHLFICICSLGSHKMKGSAHTTYAVPATALQILLMLARYIPCTPSALDNVV